MRYAGSELGLDLREGLSDVGDVREWRRALRADRMIPRSLGISEAEFYAPAASVMAPEHSEPGYSLSGAVQPEVTYGA